MPRLTTNIAEGTKRCARCTEWYPISDFRKSNPDSPLYSYCSPCRVQVDKEHYDKRRAKKEPGCGEIWQRNRYYYYKRKYGLSPEEVDDLLEQQGGVCAICKTDKPGGNYKHFTLDHCHKTGEPRGFLCRDCNLGLGLLGDDLDSLMAAVAYLIEREEPVEAGG